MTNELEKRLIVLRKAMSGLDAQPFLDAVDAVEDLRDEQAIVELLLLLHGEEDHELYDWMSTIMHAAEAIGTPEQYTSQLLLSISSIKGRSAHWAERLVMRVMNDPDCFDQLVHSAGTTSEKNRVAIRAIASAIVEEGDEFEERAKRLVRAYA